jgi:hypothetical protein
MRQHATKLAMGCLLAVALARPAPAADQLTPGAGNPAAVALGRASPLVESARAFILAKLGTVQDAAWRNATRDAIDNAQTCVAHRAGVRDADKRAIIERLRDEGLIDPADDEKLPGGLLAGVFPPLLDDGSACPHLPQAFYSSPAGVTSGHHSYPGGLAIHEAFNLSSFVSLADNYRRAYGHTGPKGLPTIVAAGQPSPAKSDVTVSADIAVLAPTWHDWGKIMVFQWNADGTEFIELNFGGTGKTDNNGAAGDSKTGAHHIISLAESIKRGFPPEFIVTQASAHAAPTYNAEYKVVNWIRAAALMAQVDPIARRILTRDAAGHLRLAPMRKIDPAVLPEVANEPRLLVEYVLHNLSDADYTFTGPAVAEAETLLKQLAPRFGYNPADLAAYNNRFRNPALAYLSAERIQILDANDGIEAVARQLETLKRAGVI